MNIHVYTLYLFQIVAKLSDSLFSNGLREQFLSILVYPLYIQLLSILLTDGLKQVIM